MSTAELFPRPPAQAAAEGPLEARLAALAETVARLENRIAVLEGSAPLRAMPSAVTAPDVISPDAVLPSPVRLLGLIGRTCLVLGGATFIRALVDAGTIHRGWGVALGLAYAITWVLLANRARQTQDASFHGLASVLIAYPLLVESTVRFGILAPGLAALLLLAVSGLHGFVTWRRDLQPLMWTATLASLGSGLAMMAGRQVIEPFLGVFLVLGVGTLWLTHGRKWLGLRWPTALAADLGVLILTSLAAWPGGTPEAYRGITATRTMLIAATLVLLYLGTFAVRMFRRQGAVTSFEVVQSSLVLLVGFGGALRVAHASGSGAGLLGAGAILAGIGCCMVSARFVEDQEANRPGFTFFSFLALILLLLGGPILLPLPAFALLGGGLGLAAMLAGLRLQRAVLILQSALYLLAAVLGSGLGSWTLRAFLAPSGPVTPVPLAGLLAFTFVCITLGTFLLRPPPEATITRVRPLILVLGALAAAGFGGLVIRACCRTFASGAADAGVLAAVRTGVLSALIIALAWFGRRMPLLEWRWLVYPMMIITALKFLFEDVAVGRPLTLFLGFMSYGATLMLAPRLLKAVVPPGGGSGTNASLPEVDS